MSVYLPLPTLCSFLAAILSNARFLPNTAILQIEMTGNVITRDYYLPLAEAFAFNAEYKHIKYLDVSNNPNMDEKVRCQSFQPSRILAEIRLVAGTTIRCQVPRGSKRAQSSTC